MKIRFTRPKLAQLKDAYLKAGESGADEFEFEGQRVLTSYARYLIEYLETQFSPTENKEFYSTLETE